MSDMRSPFERLLGAELERLPPPVRRAHSIRAPLVTSGRAEITAAKGFLPRFVCWFAGLPRPGRDVEVSVVFTPTKEGGEHWDRKFADRRYASTMHAPTAPMTIPMNAAPAESMGPPWEDVVAADESADALTRTSTCTVAAGGAGRDYFGWLGVLRRRAPHTRRADERDFEVRIVTDSESVCVQEKR